jgi:hypothetical protein
MKEVLPVIRTVRINDRRVAAPAAPYSEADASERAARQRLPAHIDSLCHEWGTWVATRRLAAPRPLGSVLWQLRVTTGGLSEGPRMRLDAHVAAFHTALQAQDERAQSVLYGLYALPLIAHRRIPVKRLASALRMHRATVYRVRDDAATRAYNARLAVLDAAAHCLKTEDVATD